MESRSRPKRATEGGERLSSESYRLLVDSVTDHGLFMLDPGGQVQTWNPGAARMTGYAADEIVGRHFSVFFRDEQVRGGKCELALSVAERTGRFEEEGWRLRKDGSQLWASDTITAIRGAAGELRGFAQVTRDLTEPRNVEERVRQSELRLRLLIESIEEYAIFMLDARGYVSTWNAGAQRIKQYTSEEIIGRHFSTFYPEEAIRSGHPQHELEIAAAEGRYEEEGWRLRKDGSRFWANVVISAVRDRGQGLVGFAKVTRDMTDRKQAERDQAARIAAEQANRAKDEFLAMLGHELRNPLAPTLTALQLIKLRGDLRSSKEQEIIERQLRHMVRLVDDLLDVARITRGNVPLRKDAVDMREVLARAVEQVGPLIEERRHTLAVEVAPGDIVVEGDAVRLAQTFANLLTNAAKYTDPGGRIEVKCRIEGGQVITEVRDNGAGIEPDLLPRVFDTFVQAPQTVARSAGGLGIGLALVRSFVTLHGGSVEARSPGPRKGSTFTVRLPLDQQHHQSDRRDRAGDRDGGPVVVPAPRPGRGPLRVLVVDDNPDVLFTTGELLRLVGHEVLTAGSSAEALRAAGGFRPDVAILDIGLPHMDGYELAAQLRARLGDPPPRLIAVTGYGQDTDRVRSRHAGFERHLVKPVEIDALLHSLHDEAQPP
jgi:PAS domain S-box-containing protein